jgi:hypothetical protein
MDRRLLEYRPEIEELEHPLTPGFAQASTVAEEERAAAELLEHLEQGELEGYLVELIDRAGRPRDPRVRRTLAVTLGRAARRVLRRGDAPPASAGRLLGLELEGLSPEDQAFEVARQVVRLASEAAHRVSGASGAGDPAANARRAFEGAARSLAPGLLPPTGGKNSAGLWVRRADELIVLNP